jgi:hypothetical protein
MFAATVEKINASSLAHVELLNEFIQLTQEKAKVQTDPFVRESLTDLLITLRDERDGYIDTLGDATLSRIG